jgi:pyridoxal phosphate enzyme (YggS family)
MHEPSTSSIVSNLHHLQQQIRQSEHEFGRKEADVRVLAVSKGQCPAKIEQAFHAGLRDFGENYYQEARTKQKALINYPITWHFIGPIQSNKAKGIAEHFSWIHSLCRQDIAQRLHLARPSHRPALNVCLQVKLDDEPNKAGVLPSELMELARFVLSLQALRLRGLMVIPAYHAEKEAQYQGFLRLAQLFHAVNQELKISMDTLSMGMSEDFNEAIRAGSTLVRIGTALFGPRS